MSKCICGHDRERHMWRIDHKRVNTEPQWCHDCECKTFTNYYHSLARYEESIRPEGVEDFLEEFIPLVNRYASKEGK